MAKKDEMAQKLRALLSEDAVVADEKYATGVAFSAKVPVSKLRDAVAACKEAEFYLESMTGLDFKDTMEVVYHLNCFEPMSRLSVRVLCAEGQDLPTVSDMFDSALWQEREVAEFFGIVFAGHPELKPLLLPEDADYHPLRKTFGQAYAYRTREEIYG